MAQRFKECEFLGFVALGDFLLGFQVDFGRLEGGGCRLARFESALQSVLQNGIGVRTEGGNNNMGRLTPRFGNCGDCHEFVHEFVSTNLCQSRICVSHEFVSVTNLCHEFVVMRVLRKRPTTMSVRFSMWMLNFSG
jgi:hypothetical protein